VYRAAEETGGGHRRSGERGGRSRHTLGRSTGWRATESVLPTARRQNTGPTDSLRQ